MKRLLLIIAGLVFFSLSSPVSAQDTDHTTKYHVKKGVKKGAQGVKKGATKTGQGIKKGASEAGHGVKKGAKKAGQGVKKAGQKVGEEADEHL
jgi:hypothetical protein